MFPKTINHHKPVLKAPVIERFLKLDSLSGIERKESSYCGDEISWQENT